jgi:hypothetical protein
MALGVFCLALCAAAAPVTLPSIAPSSTPGISNQRLQSDSKVLLREYLRAQRSEVKAIEHRNQFELKELKASQNSRRKEWEAHEKEERYKFFEAHPKGSERREYVQDFIRRRDEIQKQFSEEKAQKIRDQEKALAVVRQEQAARLSEFKKAIAQGQHPSPELWPKAGQ